MLLLTTRLARADQVALGEQNFPGAKVLAAVDGQIRFQTADGELRNAWLDEVSLLILDRGRAFEDFNEAERYMATGELEKAVVRYKRALRGIEGLWAEIGTARQLVAFDRTHRLDEATLDFIVVVRSDSLGPAAAMRLMPNWIPDGRAGQAMRAVAHLDAALASAAQTQQRIPMVLLRYDILQHAGDGRADKAAATVAGLEIPAPLRCHRAYEIQLVALNTVLEQDDPTVGLSHLDHAIRDCPSNMIADFLLLKGETLSRIATTRNDIIRASWPFMRVAIHWHDDARAADGLLGAALALERIGRPAQARSLLKECLAHPAVQDHTEKQAREALDRLAPG